MPEKHTDSQELVWKKCVLHWSIIRFLSCIILYVICFPRTSSVLCVYSFLVTTGYARFLLHFIRSLRHWGGFHRYCVEFLWNTSQLPSILSNSLECWFVTRFSSVSSAPSHLGSDTHFVSNWRKIDTSSFHCFAVYVSECAPLNSRTISCTASGGEAVNQVVQDVPQRLRTLVSPVVTRKSFRYLTDQPAARGHISMPRASRDPMFELLFKYMLVRLV
jgi:hypothetical protein